MKPYDAIRTRLARSPEAGAAAGFSVIFLVFALATPDTFLSHSAISSILNSQAVPGILAIGITLLMISGEFDLSVGSILGASSLAFLYATVNGVPILLAAAIGLIIGCLLGLINGLLLISTGIPSFIITLGTMLAYRAIPLTAISGGRIIRYADYSRESPILEVPGLVVFILTLALLFLVLWIARDIWRARNRSIKIKILVAAALLFVAYLVIEALVPHPLMPVKIDFFSALNGRIGTGNYRTSILWWIGLTVAFAIVLSQTRFGNAVFATGGNAQAARLQGIRIDRVRVTNFVISGFLAALAGIIQVARLKSVDPLRGTGLELEVIAAVVIGGTLLTGGYGSLIGSAIGTALTGMLRTGLVLMQIPSNAFRGAIGAIMIAAVVINNFVRKER
ncbi:MAG: ABC transporter permease [Candidatus Latescibacteria bacterium]|nr:ABC transporter permease [Candidatus Latescibacterota bacterium]